METLECFLLTRHWRDAPDGLELTFWGRSERGPVRVVVAGEEAVCFVERGAALEPDALGAGPRRRALDLSTLAGAPVDGLYFRRQRDLADARSALRALGARLHESDVKPSDRYLMERFVTSGFEVRGTVRDRGAFLEVRDASMRRAEVRPNLAWASIDIETEGLDGALLSIAAVTGEETRAFLVADAPVAVDGVEVECAADERGVLAAFFAWLHRADPDLLIGWNVVGFDLDYLERRCAALGVGFDVARGGERAAVLQPGAAGTRAARVPGRVVLDGIEGLRAAFWQFESFELDHVARELLGRGKDIDDAGDRVEEIVRLHREDPARLVRYNVGDCRLVADIFERAELVRFCARRAELTGLAMDRVGGSVAAFDNLYLPRLHRKGRVAPDTGDSPPGAGSPGGYVLDSEPGLYDNVLLLDFKSLYPSIIRTFRIDPWGLHAPGDDPVPGFEGAAFAREGAILPELIESLWAERDRAKRRGDAPMSQAVKILMNSFYGVLGASGCRFHDARLASSITRRGHAIILRSREIIEARGARVIYGDTDSLFVLLGDGVGEAEARERGAALAAELNAWWREHVRAEYRLESFLEIEFETLFSRFLMPTVRGEATGSKKRYAGLVRGADGAHHVVFKGLESVRTDWTPLARRFQRELYRRVFLGEAWEAWVKETLDDLLAGRLDAELVYRKRLRRAVDAYQRNVPPHVQAARKLDKPGRWVSYVITASGPEPVREDGAVPRPDHAHYRDRQLAPAADGILHFLGTSFDEVTDRQLAIF